ncbi:MAG TPA: glycosyltransferase family 1 protein [Verrucomicrobiae bacterium]|nr:glycosyltransferase family 1 protein [Verrucomicrobiae bacterium]
MRSLKLAWDNTFARRNQTGSGVYASRLLEHLVKRQDLEVHIFEGVLKNSPRRNKASRAWQTASNLLWTHLRLSDRVALSRFDVLHSPAYIAPLNSPCPAVVTVHDITYLLYPEHFASWWVAYMKAVMPRVLRSAAAIICGSQHSKADIVRTYRVPAGKVHVIPYGIDSRFSPSAKLDPHWAAQLNIRREYLLHVGELSHRKNIPTLLRAVAQLRQHGDWGKRQVVLAGPESQGMLGASEIHDTIREEGLSEIVVLAGRVPDEQLAGLYTGASLLVMPSLYEGFGFPVLEAMASGTPVIASNTSSLPEVAGDAAILVPPHDEAALADAIRDVLNRIETAEGLRRRGLAQSKRFSWAHTAEETARIYRSVAER